MRLLRMEVRRTMHRRAVRWLVGLGVLACGFAGVVSFLGSRGKTLAELRFDEEGHPAVMTEWWNGDTSEGFLVVAVFFLLLGGVFGGATVAGGEWRAGTVTTLLTWEPRRIRLLGAQAASAMLLAFVISFALQALFLASFLPSVLAHGTTDGVDGAFWWELTVATTRMSLLAGVSAVLAIALATIARNTAFAVIAVFTWMAVIESLIRGLKPSLSGWLWAENLGTVIAWGPIPDSDLSRGPLVALTTLLVYCAAVVAAAAVSFQRRDIASAS